MIAGATDSRAGAADPKRRILVVDDEPVIVKVLSALLKSAGYDVLSAPDGNKAHEYLQTEPLDILLSDIRMSPVNGMELLKWARAERPEVSVVMLTAFGTITTAIDAMKLGAFDYVTKPFKVAELLATVKRALAYKDAITESPDVRGRLTPRYRLGHIIAESPAMKDICGLVERVAPSDTTVLICGERDTGKEMIARAIHDNSSMKNGPFLTVNCTALPEPMLETAMFGYVRGAFAEASADKEGLFESAQGGTVFIDEIGSMPMGLQAKFLRVLQEKETQRVGGNGAVKVNCRVVTATSRRLDELVQAGTFRQDLFGRLNVIPITIPPLRERKEDIVPFAYHVMRGDLGSDSDLAVIPPDVRQVLESYQWPGNVGELANAIKYALTFGRQNEITLDVLPAKIVEAVGPLPRPEDRTSAAETLRFESLKAFILAEQRKYSAQVLSNVTAAGRKPPER